MNYRRVLSLDQATLSGVAWTEDLCESTRWSTVLSVASGDYRAERHSMYCWELRRRLDRLRPDLLTYEEPQLRSTRSFAAALSLFGLADLTEVVCYEAKVPFVPIKPDSITKHALGEGRARTAAYKAARLELVDEGRTEKQAKAEAKKRAMVRAAEARGWTVRDDNEAEALLQLDLVCQLVRRGEI